MGTDVHLLKAIDEANLFAERLHRRRFRNDLRSRTVAACLAVSQQHHNAILILLSRNPPLEATSFALLRPLVESVIRGLWLSHAATDAQINEYVRSGTKLDMASMMKSLDEEIGLNSYKGLYQKNWSILSAYTHTGELQVQRWLTTAHVEPKYSEQAVSELVELSGLVAKLACEALLEISLEPENRF
ncbi:MAG: hypothetical protein C4516_03095 [Oxalobacter sp.]|nr:MAG: hypothetical protein C4516_03095 [Oxalobacter sp.]